jgi:HSP20 family molecular chaperone IbpA
MALMMPVFSTMRPMDSTFEESRKKLRSQVDRMWAEMQQEILNHKPLTFGSIKSKDETKDSLAHKDQSLQTVEDPSKKSMVVAEDGSFQLTLPVSSFKPEELTVKVVNNSLLIEAHHEEKDEKTGSFTQRHFKQQFLIPKSCDKESLASSLSADGVLTVTAPSKAIEAAPSEKIVR